MFEPWTGCPNLEHNELIGLIHICVGGVREAGGKCPNFGQGVRT